MNGIFISLDGVDGAGKTTQIQLLIEWYQQRGRQVLAPRDPGSTRLGETLRDILLHRAEIALDVKAEMLLYMASRAQLVSEVIRPALAGGQVVIADRYLLANVVYQGCAGGEDIDAIWQVGRIATGGLLPQLTCVLDLPTDVARGRLTRGLDRLESRGSEYMDRVRQGFLQQSQRMGTPVAIIDAQPSADHVHQHIVACLQAHNLA